MIDRKAHWEDVYAARSPLELSWYQAEPHLSLELIARAGVARDAPIIDVGGGASMLVDALLDQGFTKPAVLDLSESALRHARRRLATRATQVEWYEQDVTRFPAPHRFVLWHDRAVFHFLTRAEERENYVRALRQAVAPGGHVIMAAFAVGGPRRCSGLDVVQYDAARMRGELGPEFQLIEERSERHMTPAGGEQLFGYFRFIRCA